MKILWFISLLICPMLYTSCNEKALDETVADKDSSAALVTKMQATMNDLEDTEWIFANYGNSSLESEYENIITLSFTNKLNSTIRYGGKAVVNFYQGAFEVSNEEGLVINMGETITTLMAGTNERDIDVELDYMLNLEKATYFEIIDGALLFYLGDKDKDSTVTMNFVRK